MRTLWIIIALIILVVIGVFGQYKVVPYSEKVDTSYYDSIISAFSERPLQISGDYYVIGDSVFEKIGDNQFHLVYDPTGSHWTEWKFMGTILPADTLIFRYFSTNINQQWR